MVEYSLIQAYYVMLRKKVLISILYEIVRSKRSLVLQWFDRSICLVGSTQVVNIVEAVL